MIGDLLSLISKVVPNKGKAKELEAKIAIAHNDALQGAVKADVEVRIAELKSGGLAAVWRPLAAIMTYLCVFLYWFIYPLVQIIISIGNFDVYLPQLEPMPLEFYGLSTAFVSIYAFGRSLEKRSK